MRVVICGGGVIGASLAYFLSLRRVEAVVVERRGLRRLGQARRLPRARLVRRLGAGAARAVEHGGRWRYRRLETLSVVASAKRRGVFTA